MFPAQQHFCVQRIDHYRFFAANAMLLSGSIRPEEGCLRKIRRTIEVGLTIAGTVLVFAAVVLIRNLTLQIGLVLIGLLVIDAGIWKLTQPLLPNERQHNALRMEVNNFLVLVRRLNEIAVGQNEHDSPAARAAFRDAVNALHDAVDRIERQAGKTDADLKPTEVPAAR